MPEADLALAALDVRRRAAEVAHSGELWVRLAGDLGRRQYAWPWWNTLLTQPVLAALGDGVPAVAASPAQWALAGTMPTVDLVPWLVPVGAATRTMAGSGRPLVPGRAGSPGERIQWRHGLSGLRAEQVVIEATRMRSTPDAGRLVDAARSAAWVWGLTVAASAQPFDLLVALAQHALTSGVMAGSTVPQVLLVDLPAAGEPGDRWLLAISAAVGFLAAHGVSGVFGPAGLPQELARRADKAFTGLPRWVREAAVLTACHAVQVLITVLLRVVGVPEWRGGLLTMAIPPTGRLVGRWAAARGGL
ncbi:MAG TPA: hypothetical protein VIJ23_07080 [Mycobacterium sp.]